MNLFRIRSTKKITPSVCECKHCGNPNVILNRKCKYCKRLYRTDASQGDDPYYAYDYLTDEQQMVKIANTKLPYVWIGGRYTDKEEPKEAHTTVIALHKRESIVERIWNKWTGVFYGK